MSHHYMDDIVEVMGVKVNKRYMEQSPEPPTDRFIFLQDLEGILDALNQMLSEKNLKYGDSALNPSQIFSSCDPIELINVRLDDKLSRIRNAKDDDEDPEWDLIGYLILKRIAIKRKQQHEL